MRFTALTALLLACGSGDTDRRIAELEHKTAAHDEELQRTVRALELQDRMNSKLGAMLSETHWWCSATGCARTDRECRALTADGQRCQLTVVAWCAPTKKPGLSCFADAEYCHLMTSGQCVESR